MTLLLRAAPLLLFFATLTCHAQSTMDSSKTALNLDRYQWKNRLLLVFAPSVKSPPYETQMQLFDPEEAGFKDRDLVLFRVLDQGESSVGEERLSSADAGQLREHFGVAPGDFSVILVGKDGGEKRRDDTPVKTSAIFDEIDAMPMRQREMREQRN
ncbi:MAG: DUF4174 domain-containing protein [Rhodothermales bacterium]